MNTAVNNPVRRSRPEINTGDLPIGQPKPIILPADGGLPDREEIAITPAIDGGKVLSKYMSDIAFAEEPVTIRIERRQGKFAPRVEDCWCNGKGAELLYQGKWITKGWLPVGVVVTTKRKYVEILMRAKRDDVRHEAEPGLADEDNNLIDRSTSAMTPLTVIRDDSPAAHDWYAKIMAEG